ncbi:hypothetical protein BJX99DRAFT_196289 [Aspergillus californicus]
MVSVTRELGSPAALLDLSARNSRRSSSRASQRTAPVPDLNTSTLTQSSYSLPPTPLASSFDDILPSAKRRRTQRSIYSEDKNLPAKGAPESPTNRAYSEPFQTPNSHKSSKLIPHEKTAQSAAESEVNTIESNEPVITASPNPNPSTSEKQVVHETAMPVRSPSKQKTIIIKPEPTDAKGSSSDSSGTMGIPHSHQTRKSISTRLDDAASQENSTTPKPSTLRISTPQTYRRDRRSRVAASTGAKLTKSSPATRSQSTPLAGNAAQPQANGTTKLATPVKLPYSTTPNTATRSRRSDRAARADNQTPSSNQEAENTASPNKDNEHRRSQPSNKLSNTVTLNIGRKSLASILAQRSEQKSHNQAAPIEETQTPGHDEDSNYFEYDSEMYKNNYGLDGHVDAPTSPTSISTSTSTAARASGRARKPTIRALESFESEQRYRRPRAASVKQALAPEGASTEKTHSSQEPEAQESTISTPHQQQDHHQQQDPHLKQDIKIIAKLIYELAAAAVAPDFVPEPEVETWVTELHQKVDQQHGKEHQLDQPTEPSEQRPTEEPIVEPTEQPTEEPIDESTDEPTEEPTEQPSEEPTEEPSEEPTVEPIEEPTGELTEKHTEKPIEEPEEESMPITNKAFLNNVQALEPRTDEEGWMHTGQVNQHQEEFVIVPSDYEWYRPNNNYGDKELPMPPVRFRTLAQAEKDRVFGYPPRIGDRNVPADNQGFFLFENVPEEKAKLVLKEAARARGIQVNRFMPIEELDNLIHLHDSGQPPPTKSIPAESIPADKVKEPSRKRRRTETPATNLPDYMDSQRPKRRRHEPDTIIAAEPAPEPITAGSSSEERKSLKVKLTFENKILLQEILENCPTADQGKKRSRSEIEDSTNSHDTRSPKTRKTSTIENNRVKPVPSTPAKVTNGQAGQSDASHISPESPDDVPETTPGGRPRRRATDALMAGFQRHAEDRARRAERARRGHARKKGLQGTPLKNVTGVHSDPADSQLRSAVNHTTHN